MPEPWVLVLNIKLLQLPNWPNNGPCKAPTAEELDVQLL